MLNIIAPLLVLAAGPALGEEPTTTMRVSVADLDLSTPAGQATLEHRIHDAAWTLCRPRPFASISEWAPAGSCSRTMRPSS